MQTRISFATLSVAAFLAVACSDDVKEQSPGEVLAHDSMLASELKQADTSAFADAADVAMAFDPDSAMPPASPGSRPTSSKATATHAPPSAPSPSVPMRVDRAGSPAARTATSPSAVAILERVPGASLPPAGSAEPCASPVSVDQRRCLMLHLARSDVALDHTYQALIAAMKRGAGTPPGGAEPPSVKELRAAQRAWLVYRDTECRRRNLGKEGPLWAPIRAQCLGEFSGYREEELTRALLDRRGR